MLLSSTPPSHCFVSVPQLGRQGSRKANSLSFTFAHGSNTIARRPFAFPTHSRTTAPAFSRGSLSSRKLPLSLSTRVPPLLAFLPAQIVYQYAAENFRSVGKTRFVLNLAEYLPDPLEKRVQLQTIKFALQVLSSELSQTLRAEI